LHDPAIARVGTRGKNSLDAKKGVRDGGEVINGVGETSAVKNCGGKIPKSNPNRPAI